MPSLTPYTVCALAALAALTTSACGNPSNIVRPTVSPTPVAIVNQSAAHKRGQLSVGLDPGTPIAVAPQSCAIVAPPANRNGELRVQVIDPENNTVVLDLYGQRLKERWSPCDCGSSHFERCVTVADRP